MRRTPSRTTRRLVLAAVLAALAAAGLLGAGAAAASSPSPAADAATLTCTLSPAVAAFGDTVQVSGTVTPAAEGEEVVISFDGTDVGTATTDVTGAYTLGLTARRGGEVVARLAATGETSAPQTLTVTPAARLTHAVAVPFLKTRFVVRVSPSSYEGLVTLRVSHRGGVVGSYKVRVRNGSGSVAIPLRGVDRFTFAGSLPADGGLAASELRATVVVPWRKLSAGSSGPFVKGMLTGLQRLMIRVPGTGTSFTGQVKDSVVAFQKAYRLSRTYVFGEADWHKLDGATIVKPRYSSPAVHLEVDKGRQILMIVKKGKVAALLAVSTGATNNTPEGTHHIQQMHPYTTSGYGGIMFRTMGFQGDFGIHGWPDVPPYPASHGCVREPMWLADWVYRQCWVGETLYVYH